MTRNLLPSYSAPFQASPRGSGYFDAPFSPLNLPGLMAWYDAESLNLDGYNDGDLVASWKDLSGNGRHEIQAVQANQPIFRKSNPNLLSYNQSTLAIDLTGWQTNGNCTVARDTVAGSAYGSANIAATSLGAGAMSWATIQGVGALPAMEGLTYSAQASFKADPGFSQTCRVRIRFQDANGTSISLVQGSAAVDNEFGWTVSTLTAVAPAGTRLISVVPFAANSVLGEVHHTSAIGLYVGNLPINFLPAAILPNGRSLATVQFNGVTSRLGTAQAIVKAPSTTLIAVCLAYVNRANERMVYHRANNGVWINTSQTPGMAAGAKNPDGSFPLLDKPGLLPGFNIGVGLFTNGAAPTVRLNGVSVTGGIAYVYDAAEPTATLFVGSSAAPNAIEGNLSAVLMYDHVLTAEELRRIERYLANRYGVAVAA